MNNPRQHRNRIFGTHRRTAGSALALASMLVLAVVATGLAEAQSYSYSLVYTFTDRTNGAGPNAGLVLDTQGNLYGTAGGGAHGFGTVFKVDTAGKETVLYSFTGTGGTAIYPKDV